MTENDNTIRSSEDSIWDSLSSLLPIGDKLLNDYEKAIFIGAVKAAIAATTYEDITLIILQTILKIHLKGDYNHAGL